MENRLLAYHTLCCFLDVAKMYLIIHCIIGFQKKENKRIIHFTLFLIPLYIAILGYVIPAKYISIVYLPIILLVLQIMSGIWHVKSFLLSLISYVIICELDFFNASIFNLTPTGTDLLYRSDSILASIATLTAIGMVSFACKKLNVTFYKKNFGHKKLFVLIEVAVLFLNIAIIGVFFGALSENDSKTYSSMLLAGVIVVSMMFSIITLIFYSVIMNVKEYQILHDLNQKQISLQKVHYERLKEINQDTRKFHHDTKNHLLVIHKLLEEEQFVKAGAYLNEYTEQINELEPVIQTGSYIANAILNEADRRCHENGILLTVSGVIHDSVKLSNTDMVTILGNAIDNAIEACERITNGERWINVKFRLYNEFLDIVMKNSTNGNVTRKTQKADKYHHGFGMRNMTECVERNGGSIKTRTEQNIFILDVLVKAFEEISV